MTPTQLIEADARKRKLDASKVMKSIHDLIQSKKATLMQEGDTLLLLRLLAPATVEAHLFTEDQPIKLARNILRIVEKMRKGGLKKVYGKADNPQIVQLLSKIGLNVQKPDQPKYNWMVIL